MTRTALAILLLAACGLAASSTTAPAFPAPSDPPCCGFHEPARIDELPSVQIAAEDATRFLPIEVHIDPGHGSPLAAWQFDLTCDDPAVRIVGLEGADHAAFNTPPFYDPAAMKTNRVIAAAFNTAPSEALPADKLRVATVMVMIPAGSTPSFALTLTAAADADAKPLPNAAATILEGTVR